MVVVVQQPSAECTAILNRVYCLKPPTSLWQHLKSSQAISETCSNQDSAQIKDQSSNGLHHAKSLILGNRLRSLNHYLGYAFMNISRDVDFNEARTQWKVYSSKQWQDWDEAPSKTPTSSTLARLSSNRNWLAKRLETLRGTWQIS